MKAIFSGCVSLSNVADISKWNLRSMTDMSEFFCGCTSLTTLPDISLWDLTNVKSISKFFIIVSR
jgi:surface protein